MDRRRIAGCYSVILPDVLTCLAAHDVHTAARLSAFIAGILPALYANRWRPLVRSEDGIRED